jgi:hypothetical protein
VVSALLQAHSEGAREKDEYGDRPLDYALRDGAPAESVAALVAALSSLAEADQQSYVDAAQQDKVTALPKAIAKVDDDDDEEFVPKAKAKPVVEEVLEEPTKRVSKKAEHTAPAPKTSFADVISEWDDK